MKRPNILVFMTDQQHFQTVGEGSLCRTPHADALARRGVTFSHAFTPTPICTPARASVQTGLTPHQHRLVHNTHTRNLIQRELPEEIPALGGLMRDAGYATAYIGKWHVGVKDDPLAGGYERHVSPFRQGRPWPKPNLSEVISIDADDPRCLISAVSDVDPREWEPHVYAEATADLIREFSVGEKPFFIFASSNLPHIPWICPQEYADLYCLEDIPRWPSYDRDLSDMPESYRKHYIKLNQCRLAGNWELMALALTRYFGMVTMLDDAFGIMLKALEESGCLDNTLVVFTTDHGEMMGRQGIVGKGEMLLDDIIRVPLIASAPSGTTGEICDSLVSLTDLFATFLDAAGAEVPTSESRSLMPILTGGDAGAAFPDEVFTEHHGASFFNTVRGIRTRDWKYVFRAHEKDEFYDLKNDPWEMVNRLDDPDWAAVIEEARRRLVAWMERTGDTSAAGARNVLLERKEGCLLVQETSRK